MKVSKVVSFFMVFGVFYSRRESESHKYVNPMPTVGGDTGSSSDPVSTDRDDTIVHPRSQRQGNNLHLLIL